MNEPTNQGHPAAPRVKRSLSLSLLWSAAVEAASKAHMHDDASCRMHFRDAPKKETATNKAEKAKKQRHSPKTRRCRCRCRCRLTAAATTKNVHREVQLILSLLCVAFGWWFMAYILCMWLSNFYWRCLALLFTCGITSDAAFYKRLDKAPIMQQRYTPSPNGQINKSSPIEIRLP